MILKDEGIVICQYEENEVWPNIEGVVVGTQEYRTNRTEAHDHDIQQSLHADLVEYIYKAHIQSEIEYWHNDLFDESDEDSDLFIEDSGDDLDNEDEDSE
ncbi:unnamed protein product [Lactuca saligna]|uniref:Uncharacterized protein n=1 Tax=Lactuca saligna TaxID=75948 RepID=A0AA36EJL0_LACSI|nr:unnamed protein product [Lactuca saligna]